MFKGLNGLIEYTRYIIPGILYTPPIVYYLVPTVRSIDRPFLPPSITTRSSSAVPTTISISSESQETSSSSNATRSTPFPFKPEFPTLQPTQSTNRSKSTTRLPKRTETQGTTASSAKIISYQVILLFIPFYLC